MIAIQKPGTHELIFPLNDGKFEDQENPLTGEAFDVIKLGDR
jgi:hypothetical protein